MYTVIGASLLSAAASLPLTLLPLLILAVLQEGRLPASQAGWVASAYMLGQLIAVLALPALKVQRIARAGAGVALLTLLAATLCSASGGSRILLGSWLVVGAMCGAMQFLASTAAAAAPDPRQAFAFRMAVSSALGGTVVVILQMAKGFADYPTLSAQLALAFAAVAGVGVLLYRTPPLVPVPLRAPGDPVLSTIARAGFFVLFLLFVGQHGLWAFAVKGAQLRGLVIDNIMWAIALCKFAGAAVVLASGRAKAAKGPSVLVPAASVAGGAASVAMADQPALFLVGLLFWEVGMNVLAARLQAILAHHSPRHAGMWMSGAIFLGAASGPALAGWAISAGLFGVFAMFGVATALVPCLWTLALSRIASSLPLKTEG